MYYWQRLLTFSVVWNFHKTLEQGSKQDPTCVQSYKNQHGQSLCGSKTPISLLDHMTDTLSESYWRRLLTFSIYGLEFSQDSRTRKQTGSYMYHLTRVGICNHMLIATTHTCTFRKHLSA